MLTQTEVATFWSRGKTAEAAREPESAPPQVILRWAVETFAADIALASGFGAEDVVLIDMLSCIEPGIEVFTLDTGRLPEEIYEVMDRIRERYGISIATYFPEAPAVEALERERGFFSFRRSRGAEALLPHPEGGVPATASGPPSRVGHRPSAGAGANANGSRGCRPRVTGCSGRGSIAGRTLRSAGQEIREDEIRGKGRIQARGARMVACGSVAE